MQLKVVKANVKALHAKFKDRVAKKNAMQHQMHQNELQLGRAEKLVGGLGSEKTRYAEEAAKFHVKLKNLVGNVLLSAGCISYLGPFTAPYRAELMNDWTRACIDAKIPCFKNFSLVETLGDPLMIRNWQFMGLPADHFSTENALLVKKGGRWPLMIDPQAQANRWIKNTGKGKNLQVVKLSDPDYLKHLESAIRFGHSVLLENVEDTLDAAIEPILLKKTYRKGGQWLICLNDQEIPYSKDFRFYMTTKLPNPHYLPEVFVKVTIINFTVTPRGLEDQLLEIVCELEDKELAKQNDRLIRDIAENKQDLFAQETKILGMLALASESANFLEDEVLINALDQSNLKSVAIKKMMRDTSKVLVKIDAAREKYRVVATRGSTLYFVVADMSRVDPMYQYSLQYFTTMYTTQIQRAKPSTDLGTRLTSLLTALVHATYDNLCLGLFEKDKLLFAFLMAARIAMQSGEITEQEFTFFLRGSTAEVAQPETNPCPDFLKQSVWLELLSCGLDSLVAIANALSAEAAAMQEASQADGFKAWVNSFSRDKPTGAFFPEPWATKLTLFQKLLVIKVFRPDKVIFGVRDFVVNALGPAFLRPTPFNAGTLRDVYEMSKPSRTNNLRVATPIVFVLSPGADPMGYIHKLAKDYKMDDTRLKSMSLGQDQGPQAKQYILNSAREGNWVVLQNCHLSASWMPELEQLLDQVATQETCNPTYRLFLTSMPTKAFPVLVLQNSIKITNEPPKGLSSNLRRTYMDMTEEEYEACSVKDKSTGTYSSGGKGAIYKKLLFGLAFFHAVVQERRKFGAIGWNIPYDWMASDLKVSKMQLAEYINSRDQVPYIDLREIIGMVNYAGRVTDDKDERCVASILKCIFTPRIQKPNYKFFDESPGYVPPEEGTLEQARAFVASLPDDTPQAFGLHPNADITFQLKETRQLLSSLVAMQSGATAVATVGNDDGDDDDDDDDADLDDEDDEATSESKQAQSTKKKKSASSQQIVAEQIVRIQAKLAKLPKLLVSQAHESTFEGVKSGVNTIGVFFDQEVERFNKLVAVLNTSLVELQDGITGKQVMSEKLETMYRSFLFNEVPRNWEQAAYPSLKNLPDWIADFELRVLHAHKWLTEGPPAVFWLPGYFFPQGFMTAVLQRYARRTKFPIDTLHFRTEVLPTGVADSDKPAKGVLVHGLKLQGGRWDVKQSQLVESAPGELLDEMPCVWLDPVTSPQLSSAVANNLQLYRCPVYKTALRRGILSTTGHSTNFVIYLNLQSSLAQDHWIRRGTAILLA
jgi:dynein heavy chain